jgi:ribosomal protein L27
VGATYRLRTKSAILLGYENGNAVIVEPGEILTILTYNQTGTKIYSADAVSCKQNDKSYIIAEGVQYNGKNYSLPNGDYQWIMVVASEGYYNDHNHNTTDIDAKWMPINNKIPNLSVEESVLQKRQSVEIELFVKSYVDDDRVEQDASSSITGQYVQRENALTNLRPKKEALADTSNKSQQDKFIVPGITKTVVSDQQFVSATSKEDAILYDDGIAQYSIKSSGLVQNAIYEVMTLCDVVDISTGKIVPAGSVVGIYLSNENGQILVSSFGSNGFDNPNTTSQDSYSHFGDIVTLADRNLVVNGPLPNGVYGISLIVPPDNYKNEKGLSEDIVFELGWNLNNTEGVHVVKTSSSVFLNSAVDKPGGVKNNVIVAPDTPVNESDVYNPNDPDDPSNPDDSNDISIVSKDWVDRNQYNVSYRVVDSLNIQVNNSSTIYDVNDTLPVTFSFYLKNDFCPDDTHTYQYNVSFYYEVSKAEYDSANQDAKDSKQYIQVGEGKYARRFKTESLSGGDYLQDVIALNQKSHGYINYSTINDNQTISGAIYNTSWINEKLAAQSNGEYHIYIYVDTIVAYKTKGSEKNIVIRPAYRDGGVLTIKNRQLINLD